MSDGCATWRWRSQRADIAADRGGAEARAGASSELVREHVAWALAEHRHRAAAAAT